MADRNCWCTSSGPSASRSVRWPWYMSASGNHWEMPAAPCTSGEERTGPVRVEVVLSGPSGKPVTVGYGVKGGTAVKGTDYALLQSDTLTFEPGETTKEIVVDIKNHGIYDDDKTLELVLQDPKNAVLGRTARHIHTIIISGEWGHARKDEGTKTEDAAAPLMMLAMANHGSLPGLIAAGTGNRTIGISKASVACVYAGSRGYEKVGSVRVPVATTRDGSYPSSLPLWV